MTQTKAQMFQISKLKANFILPVKIIININFKKQNGVENLIDYFSSTFFIESEIQKLI